MWDLNSILWELIKLFLESQKFSFCKFKKAIWKMNEILDLECFVYEFEKMSLQLFCISSQWTSFKKKENLNIKHKKSAKLVEICWLVETFDDKNWRKLCFNQKIKQIEDCARLMVSWKVIIWFIYFNVDSCSDTLFWLCQVFMTNLNYLMVEPRNIFELIQTMQFFILASLSSSSTRGN